MRLQAGPPIWQAREQDSWLRPHLSAPRKSVQQVRGPRGTATTLPCAALLLELSHNLTLEQMPSKQTFSEYLLCAW